jgi:hypothetical protein
MAKTPRHSGVYRRSNENMRLVITTVIGAVIGFCIGISFPSVSITKLHFPTNIISYVEDKSSGISTQALLNHAWASARNIRDNDTHLNSNNTRV